MNFIIKLINGGRELLTQAENEALMKDGSVLCSRNGHYINRTSVSNSYPEGDERVVEPEKKQDQKLGILHDGSRVIKQFGEWFSLDGERDEKGYYSTRLDPVYYPECGRDCVPTVQEFEAEYRALPNAERHAKMLGGANAKRLGTTEGFKKLVG